MVISIVLSFTSKLFTAPFSILTDCAVSSTFKLFVSRFMVVVKVSAALKFSPCKLLSLITSSGLVALTFVTV